jgi:hypothetical protein
MSDIFKDNPELFTTGSFQEIVEKIERGWWEVQREKVDKLSKEIGFEIMEVLPDEYKTNMIKTRDEIEEENPDLRFYLHTYPPDKSGNDYEVVCSNDVFKATHRKRITKKEKKEVLDILDGLSTEPTGSELPKPYKVKTIGGGSAQNFIEKTFNLKKTKDNTKNNKVYQYPCGTGNNKRCIWTPHKDGKTVVILFYGTRDKLNNIW